MLRVFILSVRAYCTIHTVLLLSEAAEAPSPPIKNIMDYLSILQSFAFPVAACIIMAWYVKYITDENNKRLDQVNADHKSEVSKLSEVLQNNTLAIQKLTDFIMHDVRVNNDDGR